VLGVLANCLGFSNYLGFRLQASGYG